MVTRTPHTVLSGFGLSLGITLTWLSLIVLIPLSAVFIKSAQIDLPDLINILSSERIQRALWLSFSTALFAAAILLLTPLAFLLSTARNCRQISDILALVLGIALFPLMSMLHTGVDILISGVTAGTIGYGVHRWRERARA